MVKEISKQAIGIFNRRKRLRKTWAVYKKSFLFAILILALLSWSQGAQAQKYPNKPINLLINSMPGAGLDLGCRLIAQEARKTLGQEIIPLNKPGGGGAEAMATLVNSKNDGYTLLGTASSQLLYLLLFESVTYDLKDFTPIIQFGTADAGIVVRSDSPHNSFKDLIGFARKNPGKVSYGPPQFGSGPHLAMEHVMLEEKVNIAVIPFKGSTPAITALLGGHISSCGVTASSFTQHLKAKKVKVLATTAEKRMEAAPDAPTLLELGYPYGGVFTSIYLITAPKGTPPDIVKALEAAFYKAIETPEFRTTFKNLYSYVESPLSGQKLKEYLDVQYLKEGEFIRKANLNKK